MMLSYTLIRLPESASFDYLANLKSQKKEFDERASQLQQNITLLENRIQTQEQQLANSYNNTSILRQINQDPQIQLGILDSNISDLQQQICDVQANINSTNVRLESLEKVRAYYEGLIEIDREAIGMWMAFEDLFGYGQARGEIGQLNYELEHAINSLNDVQNNLNQSRAQLADLESQKEQLQSILDIYLAKRQQIETLLYLKSYLEKTQTELQMVKNQISETDYEIFLVFSQPYLRGGGIILIILSSVSLVPMQYKRKRSARAGIS